MMTNNIFLVDDHFMLRKGISSYLEEKTPWRVSGTFADSKSCLQELQRLKDSCTSLPSIVIVDIQLGKESGFELVEAIKNQFQGVKAVIYSMFDTLGFKLQAKDVGADAFISKAASDRKLVECLNVVQSGGTWYEENDISIQKELDSFVPLLKENEKRVFELVLQGKSNSQIKDEIFLSLHTVENYVSYILDISNCKNRAQLIEKFK